MTGSAVRSSFPMTGTVSSRPRICSSTRTRSSYFSASSIAGASSASVLTIDAPTLDPLPTGLTNAGSPTDRAAVRSAAPVPRTTTPRGTSSPAAARTCFATSLSIASAEASTPEPVYGTPMVSRSPWMRPSSPQVPWSAMSTTSIGSALAITRVAGTSARDALSICFSRPRGSWWAVSRRAPPWISRCACSRCSAVISRFRAMNASGSSSTTSKRLGSRLAAICAPVAREMSRSADAPPVSTPTRIFTIPPPARPRERASR